MKKPASILWFVLGVQTVFANGLVALPLRVSNADPGAGIPPLEQALRETTAELGSDHPNTLAVSHKLALAYLKAGRFDTAIPLLNRTLQKRQAKLGGDHPETIRTMSDLAKAHADYGEPLQAIALYEKALARTNRIFPEPAIRDTLVNDLALASQAAGKLDQAITLFEANLSRRKLKLGPDHPLTLARLADAIERLVRFYEMVGRRSEAGKWRKELAAVRLWIDALQARPVK